MLIDSILLVFVFVKICILMKECAVTVYCIQ